MNHASYAILRGLGWTAGVWMALVIMSVLVLGTIPTPESIRGYFPISERSMGSATSPASLSITPGMARYGSLPIILTVQFAVTHTQQMMVARVKHRADFAHRAERFRVGLK